MKTSSFELHWIPRIMLLLHAVGVVGILAGYGQYFLDFTAANLFINGLLAAWADWEQRHGSWIVAVVGGIGVEIIGVQTGWLFGNYGYGEVLGPMLAGVPLILGVLWWVSLMGCGHWTNRLMEWRNWSSEGKRGAVLRASIAATMMTAFDGIIEPVAIQAGWWQWDGFAVPWSNYGSWWVLSFLFYLMPRKAGKNIGTGLLVAIFVCFFLFLNWFPWTH